MGLDKFHPINYDYGYYKIDHIQKIMKFLYILLINLMVDSLLLEWKFSTIHKRGVILFI